jgi:thioredoxin 2
MGSQIVACPTCGTKNRVPDAAAGKPSCPKCKEPLPWVATANDATFSKVVLEAKTPVLVDLWAPWCGPCRMVSPVVERLAAKYAGRLKVAKVNVDESPGTARRYDAMSIPTLLMVRDGRVVDRVVGALPEAQLDAFVQKGFVRSG